MKELFIDDYFLNFEDTLENLKMVMDQAYEGIVIVDEKGIVRYINDQNARLLNVRKEEALGRHVTTISPETEIPAVLGSGIPQIGALLKIGEREMVVSRIPIKNNRGKVIGAVGMILFKDLADLKKMLEKLDLLERKVEYYHQELTSLRSAKFTIDSIIGQSDVLKECKELALRFARTDNTVLIQGESGTGKELFAHAIHQASCRSDRPFVRVNCPAIPKELFESELFGYEGGAFTGASRKGKKGKFELAHKGTIFLDEIGDLPLEVQSKLLRVVEYKEIERVGGENPRRIDFKLVVATNKYLEQAVKKGNFREDLFYRLNVCRLEIPSLRERKDDIPFLVNHFLNVLSQEKGMAKIGIKEKALQLLQQYRWPGNVRELFNMLERVIVSIQHDCIYPEDLPLRKEAMLTFEETRQKTDLYELVQSVEEKAILEALAKTNGNKRRAALVLGISRSVLYLKLKKYGLS